MTVHTLKCIFAVLLRTCAQTKAVRVAQGRPRVRGWRHAHLYIRRQAPERPRLWSTSFATVRNTGDAWARHHGSRWPDAFDAATRATCDVKDSP